MLFPLSKSFSSTRLFQSGGVNEAPVVHRVWHGGTAGASERAMEVHRLLTEKKPFDEHLKLIQRRSDELRRKDIEFNRSHKETLNEMTRRCDDNMQESKKALQQGIREFNRKMAEKEQERQSRQREDNNDYKEQRAAMEARVRSMPMLGGEPPPRESRERTLQRDNNFEAVKNSTSQYFQEVRTMKERLGERPNATIYPKRKSQDAAEVSRGVSLFDKDAILAEKRAQGLQALKEAARAHSTTVKAFNEKHKMRNLKERQRNKEDWQAHIDYKLQATDEHAFRRQELSQRVKEEVAAREERLRNRPKSYGGYNPNKTFHASLMAKEE